MEEAVSGAEERTRRKGELLAEARRTRIAWVEEARGVGCLVGKPERRSRRRKALNDDADFERALSTLGRLAPCALDAGDVVGSGGGGGTAAARESNDAAGDNDCVAVMESAILSSASVAARLNRFAMEEATVLGNDRSHASNEDGVAMTQAAASTAEGDPYDVLLDRLRQPAAAEVVNALQVFADNFRYRARTEGLQGVVAGGMVRKFLDHTLASLRQHPLWRGDPEVLWETTSECLERVVVHKIYTWAWPLTLSLDRDAALELLLKNLSFLAPEHLDLPILPPSETLEGEETLWDEAGEYLRGIDTMTCPGDKLECIRKCLQLLSKVLCAAHHGSAPGADEFLPALILLVQRVNPKGLHSNLEFIQCFGEPSRQHRGEAGYALTQLVSALHFLENVDASALTIRQEDFEKGLEESRNRARLEMEALASGVRGEGLRSRPMAVSEPAVTAMSELPPCTVQYVSAREVSEMRRKGRGELAACTPPTCAFDVEGDVKRRNGKDSELLLPHYLKLRYLGVHAADLRVADLPDVIAEYHRVAKLCEALLRQKTHSKRGTAGGRAKAAAR